MTWTLYLDVGIRILDRTSWDLDIPNPDARKLDVYLLDPLSGTLVSVCSTTVLGARDAYATETFISLQLSHLLLLVKDIDSGVITN